MIVSFLTKPFSRRRTPLYSLSLAAALSLCAAVAPANAQKPSPSVSSSTPENPTADVPVKAARVAQPEAGGSAITLETSEPLFYIAVALNTCGYDADLAASSPVRLKIRDEINTELAASAAARTSRDALCSYIRKHTLN